MGNWGEKTLLIGVITPFTTIVGAHLVGLGIKKTLTTSRLERVPRIGGMRKTPGLLANSQLPPGLAVGSHCMSYTLRFLYLGLVKLGRPAKIERLNGLTLKSRF